MKNTDTLPDRAIFQYESEPIFQRPLRYEHVARVASIRNTPAGIRITGQLTVDGLPEIVQHDQMYELKKAGAKTKGKSAEILIEALAGGMLRVRAWLGGGEPPVHLNESVVMPLVPEAFQVIEEGKVFEAFGTIVRIDHDPFRISFANLDGGTMLSQSVSDTHGAPTNYVTRPIGFAFDESGAPVASYETFVAQPDEAFYGLGERYGDLNLRGRRAASWIDDPICVTTTDVNYKTVPFYQSSAGYGVFLNSSRRAVFEMGSFSFTSVSFMTQEPIMDYFFIPGPSHAEILRKYTALTGRAPVIPEWGFGVWMSRCMYENWEQVEEVVARCKQEKIPVDVVHLDPLWMEDRLDWGDTCEFTWNEERFPEPAKHIAALREQGVRVSLWENPYIEPRSRSWDPAVVLKDAEGKPCGADCYPMRYAKKTKGYEYYPIDFTKPEAKQFWKAAHDRLMDQGVASFKTDYGECVAIGSVFHDGRTGEEMHNLYPLLYNITVGDAMREKLGYIMLFSRSAFAGSQRYPIHWGGDTQCTFGGMMCVLRGMLSMALSGFAYYTSDIGGFIGGPPSEKLFVRWTQFGLLSPISRFHGIGAREPYAFGKTAAAVASEFGALRERLRPYLVALAEEAEKTGMPLARPMCLEFPEDRTCRSLDLQFMLGSGLLVAPVFREDDTVEYYLPAGEWTDWWSGKTITGGLWRKEKVALERMPLWIRNERLTKELELARS